MKRPISRMSCKNTAKKVLLRSAVIALLITGGCAEEQKNPSGQTADVRIDNEDPVNVTDPSSTDPVTPAPEPEPVPEPEPEPVTVMLLGKEYGIEEKVLELSEMNPEDVGEVSEILAAMPELEAVDLMTDDDTSNLSLSDVIALKEAVPSVHFVYRFDLFGKRVSTLTQVVKFENENLGNEAEETIRQALTVFENCEYFLLDDCGIDDEVMAGIREDFPETKIVWRIHVGTRSALTDDHVIRMTHGITDAMTYPLRYCSDTVYMDLGHDNGITDISFTAYMPALECIILSDAKMKDISPLTNCHKLTWLELCYCDRMEDISVIAQMDSVKYLNISFTNTRDISCLMDMNLDRFCCIGNMLPQEQMDEYIERHPESLTVYSGNPYGYAWRYDDYGYHFFSYYARMREVFRYTEGSPGGFKFPEYEEPVESELEADPYEIRFTEEAIEGDETEGDETEGEDAEAGDEAAAEGDETEAGETDGEDAEDGETEAGEADEG